MSGSQLGWWRLLVVATVGLVLFGLLLVALPDAAVRGFSLMVYSSSIHIESFGPTATDYIKLLHAVLGAVMAGERCFCFLFSAQ